jgi:hypothetical protein
MNDSSSSPTARAARVEVTVSKGFMARHLGVSFDRSYYFDPIRRKAIDDRCQAWVARELADLDAFFSESNLGRRSHYVPDQILVGGMQPNLIQGILLGAEFIPSPAADADITPACWSGRDPDGLPTPDQQLSHELIRQWDRQIEDIRSDGRFRPIPPFFWDASGRAAVHGALTSAQKFLGEAVFLDMVAEPERVRSVLAWVTESNIALVQHFAGLCGIQISQVHVGECSSCMVGPGAWEEFVAPTLRRMAEALGPLRLHSCGRSDHILESASRVPGLAALDLGGETSLAKVRALLGSRFPVSIAPLARDLSADSLDALIAWLNRVVSENGAGDLTILYHVEEHYRLDVLRSFHRQARTILGACA